MYFNLNLKKSNWYWNREVELKSIPSKRHQFWILSGTWSRYEILDRCSSGSCRFLKIWRGVDRWTCSKWCELRKCLLWWIQRVNPLFLDPWKIWMFRPSVYRLCHLMLIGLWSGSLLGLVRNPFPNIQSNLQPHYEMAEKRCHAFKPIIRKSIG